MKSYLDLTKKYEKIHHKSNRITILCIVIAVSLVTAIFGMADMAARAQRIREISEHGNWHFALKVPTEERVDSLLALLDGKIQVSGYILGFNSSEVWSTSGREFRVTGGDGEMLEQLGLVVDKGKYMEAEDEIMIDSLTASDLGLNVGDQLDFTLLDGSVHTLTLCGIYSNTAFMLSQDMSGVAITPKLAEKYYDSSEYRSVYYVRLNDGLMFRQEIDSVKANLGLMDDEVSENVALLALSGQSNDSYMILLYGVAMVLFFLVLIAGVLMIAGTFNTNVEERTQFFGMLRCLGATKAQIRRYVLYESLRYLRIAVPIGVAVGIAVYWFACAYLKFVNYEFFREMPMFGFSAVSIVSGILVGFCTVLVAALAPCRRASRVSPLSAVTANQYSNGIKIKRKAKTGILHIEKALGVHHATSNKKSLLLMIGSFGISIVLFLSFSVVVDFMNHAIVPMEVWTPDIEINTGDYTNTLEPEMIAELMEVEGVKRVYGRMFADGIAKIGEDTLPASLLTYEVNQFKWAKKYLVEGNLDEVADGTDKVLVPFSMAYPYHVGDKITLQIGDVTKEVEIGAIVSKSPFKGDNTTIIMITSEEGFRNFSDDEGYTVIDIQLGRSQTDTTVTRLRQMFDESCIFSDKRLGNAQVKAANGSFATFIYGFLGIISLITIFNIINSMNMSINARLGQYGVMHAVGMSIKQLKSMIFAEAATYAILGCLLGSVIGIALNCKLYQMMVTSHWGTQWNVPWQSVLLIALLVIVSTLLSVIGPMRKINFSSSTVQ